MGFVLKGDETMDVAVLAKTLKTDNRLAKWGEKDLRIWLRDGFKCAYCDKDLLQDAKCTNLYF